MVKPNGLQAPMGTGGFRFVSVKVCGHGFSRPNEDDVNGRAHKGTIAITRRRGRDRGRRMGDEGMIDIGQGRI
jgi:hypothetical protein